MTWLPLLADASLPVPGSSKVPALLGKDMVLIVAIGLLIFAAFIGYVVFIRGPKNQHATRRIYKGGSSQEAETADGRIRRRKKKRTRRREHRQRNPTLSETGGLPPPREAQQSKSPAT